jgi:hypothetical protein
MNAMKRMQSKLNLNWYLDLRKETNATCDAPKRAHRHLIDTLLSNPKAKQNLQDVISYTMEHDAQKRGEIAELEYKVNRMQSVKGVLQYLDSMATSDGVEEFRKTVPLFRCFFVQDTKVASTPQKRRLSHGGSFNFMTHLIQHATKKGGENEGIKTPKRAFGETTTATNDLKNNLISMWSVEEAAYAVGSLGDRFEPYSHFIRGWDHTKFVHGAGQLLLDCATDDARLDKLVRDSLHGEYGYTDDDPLSVDHIAQKTRLRYEFTRLCAVEAVMSNGDWGAYTRAKLNSPMLMIIDCQVDYLRDSSQLQVLQDDYAKHKEAHDSAKEMLLEMCETEVHKNETAAWCFDVQEGWPLTVLVTLAIAVAAALDGIATYPQFAHNPVINVINLVCLGIFVVELCIKIGAQGNKPWRYLTGMGDRRMYDLAEQMGSKWVGENPYERELEYRENLVEEDRWWNRFDFAIVTISLVSLWIGAGGGAAKLRLLRLLRILRIVRQWAMLQNICRGLMTGIYAAIPIMGLYFFVVFIFALMGVDTFGLNDASHFLNGYTSLYALYQVTNMEWLMSMNMQLYGCDDSTTGGYYTIFLNKSHPVYGDLAKVLKHTDYYKAHSVITGPQFIEAAYRRDYVGNVESLSEDFPMLPRDLWCTPDTHGLSGILFYLSFIIVSGFILMTLFTGAVAVGMTASLSTMREDKLAASNRELMHHMEKEAIPGPLDKTKRALAFECRDPHDCLLFGMMDSQRKGFARAQQHLHWVQSSPASANPVSVSMNLFWERHRNFFLIFTSEFWTLQMPVELDKPKDATPKPWMREEKDKDHKNVEIIQSKRMGRCPKYYQTQYATAPATLAYRLRLYYAELSLICWEISKHTLFMATINLTIVASSCYGFANLFSPGTDLLAQRMVLLSIMKCVYAFEFLVKIISQGSKPWLYFDQRWNNFDFVVLVCTLWPDGDSKFSAIRAIRLVKILNVSPHWAPRFHVVLAAFATAIDSFAYVGTIWLLMMYMFGIVGVSSFAENDPRNFGSLHQAMFALFEASTFGRCFVLVRV